MGAPDGKTDHSKNTSNENIPTSSVSNDTSSTPTSPEKKSVQNQNNKPDPLEKSTAEETKSKSDAQQKAEPKTVKAVTPKVVSVPEKKWEEEDKINSESHSAESEEKVLTQPKPKVRPELPPNMKSLGKHPDFDFVEEDHNLHPDVMMLFHKIKVLGRGASCEVAEVVRKSDKAEFAMKIMERDDKWNPILFRQEFELLTNL